MIRSIIQAMLVLMLLLVTTGTVYAKAADSDRDRDGDNERNARNARGDTPDEYVTETVHDITLNEDAYSIWVPEGWEFEAEMIWYYDILPVFTTFFAMNNEAETKALAMLPMSGYTWFTDPAIQQWLPEGSQYNESTVVMPPLSAEDYLDELLIPGLEDEYGRTAEIRHLTVTDIESNPRLADVYGDLIDPSGVSDYYDYDAADAWIEYSMDGVEVEEKISVVIGYHDEAMISLESYGLEASISWVVLCSVIQRAPLGQLEDLEPAYEELLFSIRWEGDFLDEFREMSQEAYDARQRASE